MRTGEARWVPVDQEDKVLAYESEGWKVAHRWTGESFDSYLMVREEIQKESSLDGKRD